MARNYERHPFRKGQYTTWDASGCAFRVHRTTVGVWDARPSYLSSSGDYRAFHGKTLAECVARVNASNLEG